MSDIRVKLKNADADILLPASLSDILAHGYGENPNFSETTVKAELDKLLSLMTSSGASLDEAISALQALNEKSESTHYGSLVDLATFIEAFMVDEEIADQVIDTWKELEKFLEGITEADSLTGLLQLMYNRVNAEKSIVEGSNNIKVESEEVDTTYKDEHGDEVETTYTKYTISADGLATTDDIADIQSAVDDAQKAADDAQSSADEAATSAAEAQTAADAAKTTAEAAQTAAENALSTAEAALTTANEAKEAAESAQSEIDTLSESLDNYALKTEIPTAVSQLTNDSGYITSSALEDYATKEAVESAQADATKALEDAEAAQSTADEAAAAAATAEQDAQTAQADAATASSKADAAQEAADTALSAAETAQAAADAAQSDVNDLKDTVESLDDSKQDKLTAVAPISISEENEISIDLSDYLTTGAAEETYATKDTVNSLADQVTTNLEAISQLQDLVATGVYYDPIE